jgi:hypothetical protein
MLALLASSAARAGSGAGPERVPVLVELFTSEGCSSCPPADVLLAHLHRTQPVDGAEIVPLELHVDYWNHLGWRDPFSDAAFSDRQKAYASRFGTRRIYTPQLVVDGAEELVGGDEPRARRAVDLAARKPKGRIELVAERKTPDTATLRVRTSGLPAFTGPVDILLALVEDGLASDVTRGENEGRRLPHTAVVRQIVPAGRLRGPADTLDESRVLRLTGTAPRGVRRAIAFAQESPAGRVLAVAWLPL